MTTLRDRDDLLDAVELRQLPDGPEPTLARVTSITPPTSLALGRLVTSTLVPTPSGWTTIGGLRPLDRIFDGYGRPCTVIRLSHVEQAAEVYRVRLSDGQEVLADAQHQWVVTDEAVHSQTRRWTVLDDVDALTRLRTASRYLAGRAGRYGPQHLSTLTDLWILVADLEIWRGPRGVEAALRMTNPPEFLRDGAVPTGLALRSLAARLLQWHTSTGATGSGEQVLSTLEMVDHGLRTSRGLYALALRPGPTLRLPATGLPSEPYSVGLGLRERIPATYLRASGDQRLALLQGLMDSRGCLDANGSYELRLVGADLARDAGELLRSLGVVAVVSDDIRSAPTSRVTFSTELQAFRRARVLDSVVDHRPAQQVGTGVHIVSVEQVQDEEMTETRGIAVDSGDGSYLIAGMVPTYSTQFVRSEASAGPDRVVA